MLFVFYYSRFYVIPDPSEEDNIKYTETVDTKNVSFSFKMN